jgi:polyisoprenoid-binding protein YceI
MRSIRTLRSGNAPHRPLRTLTRCLALLLSAPMAQAAPHDYRIDPVHSRIVFTIDHLGFSSAIGTFSAPDGWVRFDPRDWGSAQVEVEIPVARIDLGDTDWNERMLRRGFFDAQRHPRARFVSTRIEPLDATHALIHGELTLRGVTRPISLDARLNRRGRHPLTLRQTAGFSAVTAFNRSDFGMNAWKSMVGDRVELRIEVEATRGRSAETESAGSGIDTQPDDTVPEADTPPPSATHPEEDRLAHDPIEDDIDAASQ